MAPKKAMKAMKATAKAKAAAKKAATRLDIDTSNWQDKDDVARALVLQKELRNARSALGMCQNRGGSKETQKSHQDRIEAKMMELGVLKSKHETVQASILLM